MPDNVFNSLVLLELILVWGAVVAAIRDKLRGEFWVVPFGFANPFAQAASGVQPAAHIDHAEKISSAKKRAHQKKTSSGHNKKKRAA